tara:strand:+ start:798 stop:1394 length:597 start_codon:yes stop_codon:yes gene_type:complete
MAIDKIQSESINLADNFAFSGTVTGAGTHTLLGTTTASSSANVTFTSSTFTGFDVYMIEGIIIQPATDNVKLRLRVAGADGSIDTGSIYNYAAKGLTSTGSDVDNGNSTQTQYLPYGDSVTTGNEADEGLSFRMWVYGVADSAVFTQFHTHGASVGSDYVVTMSSACNIFEANTTTKIQFDFSSGNIAAGKFKIYGVS